MRKSLKPALKSTTARGELNLKTRRRTSPERKSITEDEADILYCEKHKDDPLCDWEEVERRLGALTRLRLPGDFGRFVADRSRRRLPV